jgi:hypothetical protein
MTVYVQMQIIEISKIDGVEQAFHADFFMLTSWIVDLTGTTYTGKEDLTTEDMPKTFWQPQLEFINARAEVTRLVEEPFGFNGVVPPFPIEDIRPGFVLPPNWRWVTEDQRYQCDFTTPLGMHDFPFDTQYMQLLVESYWASDQVIIRWAIPSAIDTLVPTGMEIVGWTFIRSRQFPSPDPPAGEQRGILYLYNNRYYDRLTIRTLLKRQPDYYLTKIVAGVMLLVYMCVYVFALGIDEADRMMGTLSIFAGLVTFLFVASGDTPKVPYQTRLDLFMLWSFFNVAFMLVIHGTLYWWRECDIEDLLEEREKKRAEEQEKILQEIASSAGAGAEIELGVASPSAAATGGARVYVNDPSMKPNHAPAEEKVPTTWRLHEDDWSDFTIRKWFNGLHLTRKVDAIVMPVMVCIYSIGSAVILGRAVQEVKP